MPKFLHLIRHAEAEQQTRGGKDIERSLTAEGLRQAHHLGVFLSNSDFQPDLIICSAALRAVETAEALAEQVSYATDKIKHDEQLYDAPIRVLLETVNNLPKETETVFMVAHNPAISYLADYLTEDNLDNMSPCALIGLSFEFDDWEMVSSRTGSIIVDHYPKS